MKKLIALVLLAGLFVGLSGCNNPTSAPKAPPATGGAGGAGGAGGEKK